MFDLCFISTNIALTAKVTEKLFADYALPLGRAEVGDIVAPRVGLHKGKYRRVINIEGG